jgi:ribonuclease-3
MSNLPNNDLKRKLRYLAYNKNNVLITEGFINGIFNKYDIDMQVTNLSLYQEAMTEESYRKPNAKDIERYKRSRDKDDAERESYIDVEEIDILLKEGNIADIRDVDYDRLEVLGDKVIDNVVTTYLYDRFEKGNSGFITKLRSRLVRGETLAKMSKCLGLDRYILISKDLDEKHGRNTKNYLEDIFEAFIGAMYVDSNKIKGGEKCYNLITALIENHIDIVEILAYEINYKELLLKLYHKNRWDHPKYKQMVLETDNIFKVAVMDYIGNVVATGIGPTKKDAEQTAAYEALVHFGENVAKI